MNYFETLNNVNVNEHIEKKNGLSYLSWAYAWGELKKKYPDSYYTIYENRDGWHYFTDGKTAWVKTGVTMVDGEKALEHIEYLPVMDYRNRSIPADSITSFDVNKSIQRSLTKAVARHGLGLYVYAGEDLPEAQKDTLNPEPREEAAHVKKASELTITCENCGRALLPVTQKDGSRMSVLELKAFSQNKYGKVLCAQCMKAQQTGEST